VCPKEMNSPSYEDICSPTVFAALFTIAKILKQPKRPSANEWIKKI
jgi:hypothetical protein